MGKTIYQLAGNEGHQTYAGDPNEPGWPTANDPNERYADVGIDAIKFPAKLDAGNDDHVTPYVKMVILNADGARVTSAPFLYLKAPNQLNLSNINNYQQDGPIFGAGSTTGFQIANDIGGAVETAGLSAAEALEYTISKGGQSLLGFLGSAGLNNLSQFEFLSKNTVNPMQQQLYKGPTFRRYQLPFNMKPRNVDDAKSASKAVTTLKLAAAASLSEADESLSGINLTFGYPNLIQFTIIVKKSPSSAFEGLTVGNAEYQILFRSKPCVIETVQSDYGGQKMTFFTEDNYPTETNLTLSLIEILPRTLGDAKSDALLQGGYLI